MVSVRRYARNLPAYLVGGKPILVKNWRRVACIAILSVAIFASFANSDRFQKCIRENKHNKPYHALYEKTSAAERSITRIRLTVNCGFGDTDVLTSLAGIVVAIFTCTLWVSTNRLWKAGESQIAVAREATQAAKTSAQAALATIDRPYLHMVSLDYEALKKLGNPGTNTYIQTNIKVHIKNAGQSPAVVTATRYSFAIKNKHHTNFEFVRDTSSSNHRGAKLILSGGTETISGSLCCALNIKDAHKNWLHFGYYVFGQVDYVDPIRLERRVRGFLYQMPQGLGSAIAIYDPEYDYDRTQEKPSDPADQVILTLPTSWPGLDRF